MTLHTPLLAPASPAWTLSPTPPHQSVSSLFAVHENPTTSATHLVATAPAIAYTPERIEAGEPEAPATLAVPVPTKPLAATIYPEPVWDDVSIQHLLTDRVEQALNWVLDLLRGHAQLSLVSVTRVDVQALADPEEPSEALVVRQWVDLSCEQALDYWDQLGAAIEAWSQFLPDYLATIVCERIAIQVWWEASRDVL